MFNFKLDKRKTILISALALFSLVVYLLFFRTFETPADDLEIFSITPPDNATNVSSGTPIDVVFVNSVSEETKNRISVQISPSVEYFEEWLTNKQLRIAPLSDLSNEQVYTVTVLYEEELLSETSFTVEPETQAFTPPPELTEEEEDILYEDAINVQESLDEIEEDMPWYFELPIDKGDYVVVFNTRRQEFRISLYVPEDTPQNEIDSLVDSALGDLADIGVDMQSYDYYTVLR